MIITYNYWLLRWKDFDGSSHGCAGMFYLWTNFEWRTLDPPTPAAAWLLKPLVGFLKSVSTFNIFNPANIESADTSDQFAQISWSHNSPTWFIYASFSQEDHFCCCDSSNFASFACPRWVWIVLRVPICVLIMPCRHCKDSWPRRPPMAKHHWNRHGLVLLGTSAWISMKFNEYPWISYTEDMLNLQ